MHRQPNHGQGVQHVDDHRGKGKTMPFHMELLGTPHRDRADQRGKDWHRHQHGKHERHDRIGIPMAVCGVLPGIVEIQIRQVGHIAPLRILVRIIRIWPIRIGTVWILLSVRTVRRHWLLPI